MAGKRKGFGFSIGLDTSDFSKGCKSVQKAFDELFGKNIMQMSNAAVGALAGVGAAISGIAVAAYNLGSKMDALKTSFEGTWGSAQKANEQYQALKHIAENSNFGLDQLDRVDKTMKALGYDSKDSVEMIKRLADIGTANPSVSIEGLADSLLRIKNTGVVSAKSLQEFSKAGIEISDVIGKDATTALNMLTDRMTKFNGYMEGEATDIWSQIPRVVKIVQDALAELGNYINDNFKQYFVAFGDTVSDLRNRFNSLLNDEGGLAQLEETVIDFAEAITIMAIPALGRMAVAFAPVALKAIAFIAVLEAIRDLMRGLRGEGSAIMSFFKAIFLSAGKWVLELGKKIADFFSAMAELGRKAANETGIGDSAANSLFIGANAFRAKMNSLQNPVVSEEDEAWKEFAKEAEKASEGSLVGKLSALVGETVGIYEGNFNRLQLGKKGRKPTSVSPITANNTGGGGVSVLASAENFGVTGTTNNPGIYGWMFTESQMAAIQAQQEYLEQQEKERLEAIAEDVKKFKENTVMDIGNGLNEILWKSGNFFENLGEGLKELGKNILKQITQFMILKTLFGAFGLDKTQIPGWNFFGAIDDGAIDDGVVQNGHIISTHPDDYIIATKDPTSLGGKANVVVNVNNNTSSQVSTNSYFDGTREIIDIFIDGFTHNINGVRDMVRSS